MPLLMRAADRIHLHPYRVLLILAAIVLIAALAMPTVLKIAAKSFSKLPAHSRISVFSRQLQPLPVNQLSTPATAASPVVARISSGGPDMSTQVYKYREPVVFNARGEHTGETVVDHTASPAQIHT